MCSLPLQDIILPDLDAQINHDALLALKNLLEMQPQLHEVLFNSPEHKQGDQSSEEARQLPARVFWTCSDCLILIHLLVTVLRHWAPSFQMS